MIVAQRNCTSRMRRPSKPGTRSLRNTLVNLRYAPDEDSAMDHAIYTAAPGGVKPEQQQRAVTAATRLMPRRRAFARSNALRAVPVDDGLFITRGYGVDAGRI